MCIRDRDRREKNGTRFMIDFLENIYSNIDAEEGYKDCIMDYGSKGGGAYDSLRYINKVMNTQAVLTTGGSANVGVPYTIPNPDDDRHYYRVPIWRLEQQFEQSVSERILRISEVCQSEQAQYLNDQIANAGVDKLKKQSQRRSTPSLHDDIYKAMLYAIWYARDIRGYCEYQRCASRNKRNTLMTR